MAKQEATQEEPRKLTPEDFDIDNAVEVDLETDSAPDHKWDEEPVIVGRVEKKRTTKAKRDNSEDPVRYLLLHNGVELVKVWESANLTPAFDKVEVGDSIMIQYLGKEDIGNGRSMRTFRFHIHNG